MVRAVMGLGKSIAAGAGSEGDGVAVDGECGDGVRKEHCHGWWR